VFNKDYLESASLTYILFHKTVDEPERFLQFAFIVLFMQFQVSWCLLCSSVVPVIRDAGLVDKQEIGHYAIVLMTKILMQLLKIALFDFWMANEDRNANNANLLYDVEREDLVSIDYGCIFNTATFEFPLSQLTSTDTILYSDMFQHLTQERSTSSLEAMVKPLKSYYLVCVSHSRQLSMQIVDAVPKEWNVPADIVKNKVNQLFEPEWVEGVWNNFTECMKENIGK